MAEAAACGLSAAIAFSRCQYASLPVFPCSADRKYFEGDLEELLRSKLRQAAAGSKRMALTISIGISIPAR
jgi:hypothetical protein